MTNEKSILNPKIVVILGVIFVSFSAIFVKMSESPSIIIAFYRMLFTSILLFPSFIKNGDFGKLKDTKKVMLLILGGVALAFHFYTWFLSINYTSITSSTLLVNTQPIFVLIISYIFLKMRYSKKALVGILIAMAGSVVISLGDLSGGSNVIFGDLLAVLAAICVAVYYSIGGVLRKDMNVVTFTFSAYFIACIVLMIMAIANKLPFTGYSLREYGLFLLLSVVCTILGHNLFSWSLKYVKAEYMSLNILMEPIYASIWAFMLFGNMPRLNMYIGGAVLLYGIYVFNRNNEGQRPEET